MSRLMENQMLITKYQVEVILDLLIKNNLVTKEAFMEMVKEKLDNTLIDEESKLEMLSLINW